MLAASDLSDRLMGIKPTLLKQRLPGLYIAVLDIQPPRALQPLGLSQQQTDKNIQAHTLEASSSHGCLPCPNFNMAVLDGTLQPLGCHTHLL